MTNNTTNRNTDQLGYTDAAVDFHTDLPFIPEPPGTAFNHFIYLSKEFNYYIVLNQHLRVENQKLLTLLLLRIS